MMHLAFLAAGLAGMGLQPASASDLSWTPCHRLEMGGKLHDLCQACTGQGTGWRFFVSRDAAQTQCRRDSQFKSGIYRQPWAEDDEAVRKRDTERGHKRDAERGHQRGAEPVRRAVAPAPAAAHKESRGRAPATPSAAKPPRTSTASASGTATARPGSSQPARESHGSARPPASKPAVLPRQTAAHDRASRPPSRQTRQEADRKREQKKSEP